MTELVFLLEESSTRAMLEGVVPRLFPEGVAVRYIVFEGKQDLEKQMVLKLKGYLVPGAAFVVLRDQDAEECVAVKRRLEKSCRDGGKPNALVRIACRELESWYLADLKAVEVGLGIEKLSDQQNKAKFRMPDRLANASEELEKLTDDAYQKVAGSRAIGMYLDLTNQRSPSFATLIKGLKKLVPVHPAATGEPESDEESVDRLHER